MGAKAPGRGRERQAASEGKPAFTGFPVICQMVICQMRRDHDMGVGVGWEEAPGKGPGGEPVERGILVIFSFSFYSLNKCYGGCIE